MNWRISHLRRRRPHRHAVQAEQGIVVVFFSLLGGEVGDGRVGVFLVDILLLLLVPPEILLLILRVGTRHGCCQTRRCTGNPSVATTNSAAPLFKD